MSDTLIENEVPQWRETGRSPQWNELFAALAKAQGEIGGAKKDSTNPHFRSSYADLASVREVTREPLSKNGLAVVQWPRTSNGGVEIETILGHSSGQYMTCVLWMPVAKMDAHGVGSAITYGRRYALMAVTGVAPVDDDGNGAAQADIEASAPKNALRDSTGKLLSTYDANLANKARDWADGAVQCINLGNPQQAVEWRREAEIVPQGKRKSPLGWLRDNSPGQYLRVRQAYQNVAGEDLE
jgi:hypothetical protein